MLWTIRACSGKQGINLPGLSCLFIYWKRSKWSFSCHKTEPDRSFPCHLCASENTCRPYGSTLVATLSPADKQNGFERVNMASSIGWCDSVLSERTVLWAPNSTRERWIWDLLTNQESSLTAYCKIVTIFNFKMPQTSKAFAKMVQQTKETALLSKWNEVINNPSVVYLDVFSCWTFSIKLSLGHSLSTQREVPGLNLRYFYICLQKQHQHQ